MENQPHTHTHCLLKLKHTSFRFLSIPLDTQVQARVPQMASTTTALSAAMRVPSSKKPSPSSLFKPLPARFSCKPFVFTRSVSATLSVNASITEKFATGVTAGVMTTAMMVPDIAEAATSASPSLQNFLFSILAGGAVLTAIFGAVIGVSNFDPVRRT